MAPIRLAAVLVGFVQSPTPQKAFFPTRISSNGALSLRVTHHRYQNKYQFQNQYRQYGKANSIVQKRAQLPSSTKLQANALGVGMGMGMNLKPILYMSLLAVQFACQPILTKRFTPKSINRSTVVISQDITKIMLAYTALLITGDWSKVIADWSLRSWLTVAGIPAFLYCIQNMATLVAYQNLSPLTFNVLNQTKTLSAALCCYIFMGKVQSKIQIMSLILLFVSACIIEKLIPFRKNVADEATTSTTTSSSSSSQDKKGDTHGEGVLAVLTASFISGLAGALTQKNLQSHSGVGRNSYLFSMELSIASLLIMIMSSIRSKDGKRIQKDGFFHNWTPRTLIPIITNAAGGIIVGLVTKYAGAVKKGFALIFGLVLSGILQTVISNDDESKISFEQIVGGLLAAISLWMHSTFPAKL